MQFDGSKKLVESDAFHELMGAGAQIESDSTVHELRKCLQNNDKIENEYRKFLFILIEEASIQPHLKRKESNSVFQHDNHYCAEEENDPQYKLFLENLTEHEKSYALVYIENDSSMVFKYEEDLHTDLEFRRKLSVAKQKIALPTQMPSVSNECKLDSQSPRKQNLTGRVLRSATKQESGHSGLVLSSVNQNGHDCQSTQRRKKNDTMGEKTPIVRSTSNEMVVDPDYLTFHQNFKITNDDCVLKYGGQTVVYDKNIGENYQLKRECDNRGFSDVEIIDRTSFYEMDMENASTTMSEFRQQLIAVLRKPYNKKEHDKLCECVEFRQKALRHIDLRNDREKRVPKSKDGKSLLDHEPDLKEKLFHFQDDKPKCLNLLRGHFFWIEKRSMAGSFKPWMDSQCIAIKPESC